MTTNHTGTLTITKFVGILEFHLRVYQLFACRNKSEGPLNAPKRIGYLQGSENTCGHFIDEEQPPFQY